MNQYLTVENKNGTLEVNLSDDWVFANIPDLTEALSLIEADVANEVIFKCGGLREFDLSGAWLLYDKALDIEDEGLQTDFQGFRASHFKFLQHIIDVAAVNEYIPGFFDRQPGHFWRDDSDPSPTTLWAYGGGAGALGLDWQ